MIPLSITTPFWKFTRTIKRKGPSSWNELTRRQLIRLASVLFEGEADKDKLKIKITKVLFNLKWYHIFLMSSAQLAYLNTFFSFILDKNELTDNKFPSIRIGFRRFYGPIGDFSTLKGREWTDAADAFREYTQTNDSQYLDLLVAILWRPRNQKANPKREDWKGDYRIPYNPFTAEERAKEMAKLDYRIKLAILIWFRGCWEEWEQMFPRLFSGTGEQVENFGWKETMQKLTGNTFGSLEETEGSFMWNLILKMEIDLKDEEIQKLKSKTK